MDEQNLTFIETFAQKNLVANRMCSIFEMKQFVKKNSCYLRPSWFANGLASSWIRPDIFYILNFFRKLQGQLPTLDFKRKLNNISFKFFINLLDGVGSGINKYNNNVQIKYCPNLFKLNGYLY